MNNLSNGTDTEIPVEIPTDTSLRYVAICFARAMSASADAVAKAWRRFGREVAFDELETDDKQ